MSNIILIHGSYGNPNENWFPWLKVKLKTLGHNVFVPRFPTPKNQSLESWLAVFADYEKHLAKDSIVIGHSLGVPFLLGALELSEVKVRAAFLVSGFTGLLGNPKFDEINASIADREFNWEKIRSNCSRFYIYHSDDDPYVPLMKADELAQKLKSRVILVNGAGHFNKASGYIHFGALLEAIKKELSS